MEINAIIPKVPKIKKILRLLSYVYQRITRGWDDRELWDLDMTIARFILSRIKRFREIAKSYPGDIDEMTGKRWDTILGDIAYSMEFYSSSISERMEKEFNKNRVQRGLNNLARYFGYLWW